MENNQTKSYRFSSHPLIAAGLVSGLLLLAACQPIQDPAALAAQQTAVASGTALPVAVGTPEASAVGGVEAATATIATDSLRVRALPSDDAEVVIGVEAGDSFPVTGISSDGAWIQIEIEEGPDGLGWVSAEFVTLAGDITAIAVVDVEGAEATAETTVEASEEVTATVTTEATEEATAEPTEAATEEATIEATAEVTEEATIEATVEATEEVTETVTVEATETPTPEATEEATPEATVEASEEVTATATAEATEEATPEATDEANEEDSEDADLGTVTILVDLPLRVRSEPNADVENKIGSVYNLEEYTVLEISEDGLWLRIETPQFPEGSGWIAAEFAVFNEE